MNFGLKLALYLVQFLIGKRRIKYYGSKILVPSQLDWKTRLQIYSRRYERAEIDAIMKFWQDADSLLEIGGGAGILASVIDIKCKPKRHLIYEAIDTNFARIKSQTLLSSSVVQNFAVVSSSSNQKTLKFRKRERIFGSGFLPEDSDSEDTDSFIEVPTIGIDEVLKEKFDVILMDIEGYEEVLLPELIKLTKATVIFEFHSDKCKLALSALFKLCDGYTFSHFRDCTFVGTPVLNKSIR